MKASESKTTTAQRANHPLFSSEARDAFFAPRLGGKNIQRKLNIGKPNDAYEREADAIADEVVHRTNSKKASTDAGITEHSHAPSITTTVQAKQPESTPESPEEKEKEKDSKQETLQRKPIFESRAEPPDEGNNLQRQASPGEEHPDLQAKTSDSNSPDLNSIEGTLNENKGSGSVLPDHTRSEMESHFDRDLSDVRIHNDNRAASLSNQLNAQAFTYGNDIYFNAGKYNTNSTAGKHLLAHELTHTVQQSGGVNRMIQRKDKGGSSSGGEGSIDFTGKVINLPVICIPKAKERTDNSLLNPPLTYPIGYKRKESYKDVAGESSADAQREVWRKATEGEVKKKVEKLAAGAEDKNAQDGTQGVAYLKHKGKGKKLKLIGKVDTITQSSIVPTWTKSGKANAFDVDHVRELQLGGKNFINNMELLNFSDNRAAGNAVKLEIDSRIREFLDTEQKKRAKDAESNTSSAPANLPALPKEPDDARKKFAISFKSVKFEGKPETTGVDHYWSSSDIVAGKHIDNFEPMSKTEIEEVKGKKGHELIYTSPVGGIGLSKEKLLGFNTKSKSVQFSEPTWNADASKAAGQQVGTLPVAFAFYGSGQEKKTFNIPIFRMEGVIFGGHIPRRGQKGSGGLEQLLVGLDLPGMSPIVIERAELDPESGFEVRGKILPTLKVIEGVEIDFYISKGHFGLSKTFSAGEIKVPKPFKINDAAMTLFAGTDGFGVNGLVDFEIEKLGKGKIKGDAKTDGHFGITGNFDFDKKLFSGGASVQVHYDNVDFWKVHGELGIKEGTVKGIKSAKIIVDYEKEILEAKGTANVALKGVKEVTLGIRFEEEKTEIEGGIKLDKMPGIKDGEGKLKVVKTGDEYDFSGSGKITPDIPGISTQVDFEFHNDIFLVDAKVAFEKGRLKGDLSIGITNRAIGKDGKPTGQALPDYKVFGTSELALKITDNITVIAGVNLLENGEIEVKGGIKLPPKIEVVPKLFSVENKPVIEIPPISIPLFGIPLGVTTLGLEATIAPYIKASAQVGPGYLANAQAEVLYNPAHPEDLSIKGGADFEFIAEASLHAGVDFGIGLSVGIAGATGGINLDAYIKVAAQQPIFHADIKYTPATGFELNGNVKAIVAAILGFGGKLFLELHAGVWPLKKTWRWDKALFKKEIDTGLQIGFEFPFAYKNGQADVSFDKMKFVYPKFDSTFIKTLSDKLVKPVVDSLL